MKIRIRRHGIFRTPRARIVVLMFAGLISGASIAPGYAEESAVPQFGPIQFVVCKANTGDGISSSIVILPGRGEPQGFGRLLAEALKLDCGPFAEPAPIGPAGTPVPQFGPGQFVVCKANAGGGKYFTVILPGSGEPQGFGRLLAEEFELNCAPGSES